jgi:hypothetical protein
VYDQSNKGKAETGRLAKREIFLGAKNDVRAAFINSRGGCPRFYFILFYFLLREGWGGVGCGGGF